MSKSSIVKKYSADDNNVVLCTRKVEVRNPYQGNFGSMTLYYDHEMVKHLEDLEDEGYLRYKELAELLISEGHGDCIDMLYGKRVNSYLRGKEDIGFAYNDILSRKKRRKTTEVKEKRKIKRRKRN
jgi:hypothetical protein